MDFSTVANEQGSFTTPSFVSFTDEERLIGEAAKNQAAMNPANTIFDIKSVPVYTDIDVMAGLTNQSGASLGGDSMIRQSRRTSSHGHSRLLTRAETLWSRLNI